MYPSILHPDPQGSTVNMNIMGWVYGKMEQVVGSTGHTTLGAALMLGEWKPSLVCLFDFHLFSS